MPGPDEIPQRKQVCDVDCMRALAHPIRMAVLRHLMAVGARTATECAAEVGSTPSNCSWHLRQLATFGLVEMAEPADGRERPWRATHVGLDFGELTSDPVLREAQVSVIAAGLQEEAELTKRFLDNRNNLDITWVSAARLESYVLRVTPAELADLVKMMNEILRPYVASVRAGAAEEAQLAYVGVRAFLRLDATGTGT